MKVLFVSPQDAFDVGTWSGTNFHMRRALEQSGADVVSLSPLPSRRQFPLKVAAKLATKASRRRFLADREPALLRDWARQIDAAIARTGRVDVVLSTSSLPISMMTTGCPTAFWTDATFAGMEGYYPEFDGLSRRSAALGNRMESAALQRSLVAFYSSEWARRSAVTDYGKDPSKVVVVPFGANIDDPGPITRTSGDAGRCALLIIGKDWHRKGVDEAVATVSRLRRAGVPATLDVVGATPPHDRDLAPWVTLWGPLDKGTPTGAAQLDALFRRANFFILPSRADCTPVVLGEAQAYALPVVASDTGGIASMVTPDSGATFELDHFPEEASAFVAGAWSDPALYSGLSRNSRALFDNRHNWAVAVRSVLGSLEAALQGKC